MVNYLVECESVPFVSLPLLDDQSVKTEMNIHTTPCVHLKFDLLQESFGSDTFLWQLS